MPTGYNSNIEVRTLAGTFNTIVVPEGTVPIGVAVDGADIVCFIETTTDKSGLDMDMTIALYEVNDNLPDNAFFINAYWDSLDASPHWVFAYWLPTQ